MVKATSLTGQFSRAGKLSVLLILLICGAASYGQKPSIDKVELGSNTAKNGFRNETEIQTKFNNWQSDNDAQWWLRAMSYSIDSIESVSATRPSGEKADVEVIVKTKTRVKKEGISIKLVSSPQGFNQIDKRWLSHYVRMWKIPANVESPLKLFLGETPPSKPGRAVDRTFLNELDPAAQKAVIDFFSVNRARIVSDLFRGDGPYAADWVMVALKASDSTRWTLRRIEDVIKFYGDGPVVITAGGNLKIGRITMQRKGGDGGRETAKMLQFKINPVQLFSLN